MKEVLAELASRRAAEVILQVAGGELVAGVVDVYPGAWNTEHHWGGDFTQWTGSLLQKRGLEEIRNASAYYQRAKQTFDHAQLDGDREEVRNLITSAYDHILAAETSCNFYWGSRWVHRSFDDEKDGIHAERAAVRSCA